MHEVVAGDATAETEPAKAVESPRPAREAARVLALQRSIGNRRTAALLSRQPRVLARVPWATVSGTVEEAVFAGVRSRFAEAIGPDIAAAGQFQFTLLIAGAVQAVFDGLAKEKWSEDLERETVVELWKSFSEQLFSARYKSADDTRKILSEFTREAKSPEAAKLVPHLGSDADASYGAAAKIYQEHWRSGKGKPDVSKRLTVAHLFAFRRWEAQACKATATYAARRLAGSGKWGGKRSRRPAVQRGQDGPRARRRLDDPRPRLSGSVGTDEEHSVLVIDHDNAKSFFFFDPDVGGSNIYTPGYDRFHYDKDANLLTTARDKSDLAVWSSDVGKDVGGFEGWHASSGRHRYQAMRLWTE